MNTSTPNYTAADAILGALQEIKVKYIFGNLGSDHGDLIESLTTAADNGVEMPKVILCPHEGVAIAAAHGYAQVSGRAQAVFVHVDVGTQNMGGGISNALHGRVPVFIFAGLTPCTIEGELPGSRNRTATFWQDVPDQAGIVRQYVKWDYRIATGKNVKQIVQRAVQIAETDPPGPVYVTAAREVLAAKASPRGYDAQFLLAQSISGQKRSLDAAISYGDLYQHSKQGAHAQDALLGLANSQAALGDKRSACVALDSLTAQFPSPRPDIAAHAAAARNAAGCH